MKASKMVRKLLAEVLVLAVATILYPVLAHEGDVIIPTTTTKEVPVLETEFTTKIGDLFVSKDSPYCNWNKTMGPLCVYSDTDKVVVVPEGLTLPSGKLELEIRGAKVVHVYPACVPWIMIKSVGLVSTFPNKDSGNVNHKVCRTWLRIRSSRADVISDGVRDLSIKDTWVNTINLIQQKDFSATSSVIASIDVLSWEGYPSEILNTTIQKIRHLEAAGDWWVIDSHFGTVSNNGITFMASEMDITNSSISTILSHGLRITSGTATFTNVIIDRLESSAIIVENPAAFLYLYNVTIGFAFQNCIVLPDRERISIKNVTIGGASLNLSSPYLKFKDDFVAIFVSKIWVQEKLERCSSTHLALTCDFNGVDEVIEVHSANILGFQVVRINNAKSLQVITMQCNQELQLEAVNGSLPHLETIRTTNGSDSDDLVEIVPRCSISLSVVDSRLGVIFALHISNLNITNSTVKRLHEGSVGVLSAYNLTVGKLDSVTINAPGCRWKRLKVGIIYNVTIRAPLKAEDILINSKLRKGSLIIDHAHATTELSKLWVSIVQREGVLVKRGTLILKEFRFSELLEGAIYLEEGATVEIEKIIGMPDYASISVATREQVKLNGISSWYAERMIHIRNHPPPPDLGSNLTISNAQSSPFCRKYNISFSIRECDFSHVVNASVIVDLEGTEQTYQTIEIRNASFVKFYPSCIRKLYLFQVAEATTVDSDKDCETWLVAEGVHFKQITAGVHDVTLTSCTVELFSPYRMLKDLDLENTHIDRIAGAHWYGYMGVFNNSYFGNMEGLVASSFVFVLNTTIDRILPQGLTVLADGLIVNSSINAVASGGISVEGGLRIANVTIGSLAKKAIVVKDGVLVLSNVTIRSSEGESIVATLNGAVAMQNVTVAGKKVHWRGYITDSLGQDDPSLVFVNKYVEDERRASNISVPVPSESSKLPHQSSSATELQLPEDKEKLATPTSDNIDVRQIDLSSSPWKWVGVSLSVFMVILLGCCIVLAVTLVKTNNGRMLPVVFWRVMDDQNGLVAEDQPSSISSGSTRHSGYNPMSGAYDM